MSAVFWILGLAGVAYGAYWAANTLRGETVGHAKALMQGEHAVPGMGADVVVKRRRARERPSIVQLQVRSVGSIKSFQLAPTRAVDLACALEEAVELSDGGERGEA